MTRGTLRIFLGAAPGVGKTYAMLEDGQEKAKDGEDVVLAWLEDHGRAATRAMAEGLERVPPRTYRHDTLTVRDMDLDAVLARHPDLALVDELAHTNPAGAEHAKRWEDVEELLDAGIDVLTTVNIQHLESVNDIVEKITGVPQHETVPDDVLREADQIELVDLSAEALRQRMAHGQIYRLDRVDAALSNYFRVGNLTALRELALLWVAGQVDEGLRQYRKSEGISGTWEARERVVVALSGGPEGDILIRRGARIAARSPGGELMAVHVLAAADAEGGAGPAQLTEGARQRRLVERLGGTYHQVIGEEVAPALLDFAQAENATQLVLGASRRSHLARVFRHGVTAEVIRAAEDIDVHIVRHPHMGTARLGRASGGVGSRRRLLGFAVGAVLLPLTTVGLAAARDQVNLAGEALAYLLVLIAATLTGGLWPALATAVASAGLLNYYFTEPLHSLTVTDPNNVIALAGFLAVALLVSAVVDASARHARRAKRASAESALIAGVAGSVLRGGNAVTALVARAREAFRMAGATYFEAAEDEHHARAWRDVASSGEAVPSPEDADVSVPAGDDAVLALRGRVLPAEDRRLLGTFAAQVAVARETERLGRAAASARELAELDRLRAALLAAVGHDLRTPLASAKAAVSALRSPDLDLDRDDERELLATTDESLDRLARLIDDLLDVSRLQTGVMPVTLEPTSVAEAVSVALDSLGGHDRAAVQVDIAPGLPWVMADAGLLPRVVANLVSNALHHAAAGGPPTVGASQGPRGVEIRVIDHGPGLRAGRRDLVFKPFQRQGDRHPTQGIGLGLSLAQGLTEAMHGTLVPEDTPGGGLTMTVTLPEAPGSPRTGQLPTLPEIAAARRAATGRDDAPADDRTE